MGFILSYNWDHIDPLLNCFNEYLSMCESGWNVTIVIHSTANWDSIMRRLANTKLFCYRTQQPMHVMYDLHNKNISTLLSAEHRKILKKEIENYDFFVYHEDDIIFTHAHLNAYLYETRQLHLIDPVRGIKEHSIGFQRYRRIFRNQWGSLPWNEQDMIEQELFEEMPNFRPICMGTDSDESKNVPYLVVEGNVHQGMWALTQSQIKMLQEKCNYMDHRTYSREHMSSFYLFGQPCNMVKLIPGNRLTSFMILHYYQQKHTFWTPVFTGYEYIITGKNYAGGSPVKYPSCWNELVNSSVAYVSKTEEIIFQNIANRHV